MTKKTTITLLGGGNMARAIAGGLVERGYAPSSITVIDRNIPKCEALARDYGVNTSPDPKVGLTADVVILAIKPQSLSVLLETVRDDMMAHRPLVISVMSGIRLERLEALLPTVPIIRAMPNTPARVNEGMTLLCARPDISTSQFMVAQNIFAALGQTYRAKTEREFEQLTALTGCGPAFVFYLVQVFSEAMQAITPELDVSALTLQTFAGAITLMQQEKQDPATLIAQVTSKGGMTEQSMKVLYEANLQKVFEKTLNAAIVRGDELAGA